jgi:RNA polymerase sigma-70 factor (ECF subfamily)
MPAPEAEPEADAEETPTGPPDLVDHLEQVRIWCRLYSRDPHLADDVVQETALTALQQLPRLRDPDRIRPWLLRIAQRRMADELRRRGPERQLEAEPLAPDYEDDPTPGEILRGRLVRRLLRKLPAFLRSPLRQHYLQGRSLREVADRLNTTVNGVKARLYRARLLARKKEKPP